MNLDRWLDYIQALHPKDVELGLSRIAKVAQRLGLSRPATRVVSVAGTNGKGSVVALLSDLLRSHGFRVGTYTSPHLKCFNERICVAGEPCTDVEIVAAFEQIEHARQATPLTYFEYTTLAALQIFAQSQLDFAILEVGLGGRLDAVNLVAADAMVITSIALDHTDWLGDDLEQIGREKAGILRRGKPVVLCQPEVPQSILEIANALSAPVLRYGDQFGCELQATDSWTCWITANDGELWSIEDIKQPSLQVNYAASALEIMALFDIQLSRETVKAAIELCRLPGRFEWRHCARSGASVLLDVAHNPAAASLLRERLTMRHNTGQGKVRIVLAMMADKDIDGFLQALDSIVDIWYIAQVDQERCLAAKELTEKLNLLETGSEALTFANVSDAFESACNAASKDDLILVTGSFYTVAEVHRFLDTRPGESAC